MIEGYEDPFGYIHSSFTIAMPWLKCWSLIHEERFLTLLSRHDFEERTHLMNSTLRSTYDSGTANHWTNELFSLSISNAQLSAVEIH